MVLTACKRHNPAVPKVRDNTGLRSPARKPLCPMLKDDRTLLTLQIKK